MPEGQCPTYALLWCLEDPQYCGCYTTGSTHQCILCPDE